jgi:hypothetical protein
MGIRKKIGATLCLAAFALFAHCAKAGDIIQSSVVDGISPVASVLTWQCPAGSTSATASSTNPKSSWAGDVAVKGTKNVSGLTSDIGYSIKCVTPGSTSATVTITPPVPKSDGSSMPVLGYLLSWGTASGIWPNPVDVPKPEGGPVTVDNLPPGTIYFVAEAYVAPDRYARSPKSVEVTRQSSSGGSVSDSVTIKVRSLPGAPGLK